MRKNVFFSFWLLLSLCITALSFTSCSEEHTISDMLLKDLEKNTNGGNTDDDKHSTPVVINGVRWATRNVDQPGTFAAGPEYPGKLYQWNRKKAWLAIGSVSGWDSSQPTGDFWAKANDPSPTGYRVPTLDEIKKLLDETNVSNEWTTVNGVKGRKFTDKTTGSSIFLPAVGYRSNNGEFGSAGTSGGYWSSTADDSSYGSFSLNFGILGANCGNDYSRYNGFSVRPVAE
jgi:uncharacterized protein (TIGR02145 family)